MLKKLLDSKKCFKLVLGAGNEDLKHIEKLVKLYYQAGCMFFDLCMSEHVAKKVKEACPESLLCFSTGIKDDPHTFKAKINSEKCTKCGLCEQVCIQNAISYFQIDKKKCIGCLKCVETCRFKAIKTFSQLKSIEKTLPSVLKYNPACIELHICGENETEVEEKWKFVNENFDGMISLCIDRSKLGDKKVLARLKRLLMDRKPYTTIIQADGNPMSGGKDDYKTTLQAVAMAEVIQKENLQVYLLFSGGTNSKTKELARLCGVDANGVAIGSFARKIVKKYVERDDFLSNKEVFDEALKIAKQLVKTVV